MIYSKPILSAVCCMISFVMFGSEVKDSLLQKGIFYLDYSEEVFEKSLDSCEFYTRKALICFREGEHWDHVVNCYNGLSGLAYYRGDFSKREKFMDTAIIYSNRYDIQNKAILSNLYNNKSLFYLQSLQLNKAETASRKAIEIDQINSSSNLDLSIDYHNLGIILMATGDYERAKKQFDLSKKLSAQSKMIPFQKREFSLSVALLYLETGQYALAKKEYENVQKTYQGMTNEGVQKTLNRSQIGLAYVFYHEKNYEACDSLLFIVENRKSTLDTKQYLRFKYLSALNAYELFKHSKAKDHFRTVVTELEDIDPNLYLDRYVNSLGYLADIYQKENRSAEASEFLNKAEASLKRKLSDSLEVSNPALDIISLSLYRKQMEFKYEDYLSSGKKASLESAIGYSVKMLDIIPSIRSKIHFSESKAHWAAVFNEISESMMAIYATDSKYAPLAFRLFEINKSNDLLESLSKYQNYKYAGIPDSLIEKEKSLVSLITFYEKQIFNAKEDDPVKEWEKTYFSLKEEYESILLDFKVNHPTYFNLKLNNAQPEIAEVQNMLENDEMAIEYFVMQDVIYRFNIEKERYGMDSIVYTAKDQQNISELLKTISDPSQAIDDDLINAVSNLLLPETIKESKAERVIIIPDGVLQYLPFEILKADGDRSLYESTQINYQYSAALWSVLKNRKRNTTKDFFYYSFDTNENNEGLKALLCSDQEVTNSANILDLSSQRIDSSGAFSSSLPEGNIIHFATHATIDNLNPWNNKIYFGNDILTTKEIQSLELNSEIAVISACETGRGFDMEGEGVLSLSKGFFYAGCNSTVVSLWKVDDCSTSEIIEHFYTFLKEDKSRDEALRLAKLKYLETAHPSKLHPYYWAGFVQIGDFSALDFQRSGYSGWMLLALVLVIVLGGVLFKRKQQRSN